MVPARDRRRRLAHTTRRKLYPAPARAQAVVAEPVERLRYRAQARRSVHASQITDRRRRHARRHARSAKGGPAARALARQSVRVGRPVCAGRHHVARSKDGQASDGARRRLVLVLGRRLHAARPRPRHAPRSELRLAARANDQLAHRPRRRAEAAARVGQARIPARVGRLQGESLGSRRAQARHRRLWRQLQRLGRDHRRQPVRLNHSSWLLCNC